MRRFFLLCFSSMFFFKCGVCSQHFDVKLYHFLPYLEMPENKDYLLVDTGFSGGDFLFFDDAIISKNKTCLKLNAIHAVDLNNISRVIDRYCCKKFIFCNNTYENVTVCVSPNVSATLYQEKEFKDIRSFGLIGLKFFRHKQVVLDFPRRKIWLHRKFPLACCRWLPFSVTSNGIEFVLELYKKKYRVVLDTGSNISMIKKDVVNKDSKLKESIRQCNYFGNNSTCEELLVPNIFGNPLSLLTAEMKAVDFDILIGMDFLKDLVVSLDFINNKFCIFNRLEKDFG